MHTSAPTTLKDLADRAAGAAVGVVFASVLAMLGCRSADGEYGGAGVGYSNWSMAQQDGMLPTVDTPAAPSATVPAASETASPAPAPTQPAAAPASAQPAPAMPDVAVEPATSAEAIESPDAAPRRSWFGRLFHRRAKAEIPPEAEATESGDETEASASVATAPAQPAAQPVPQQPAVQPAAPQPAVQPAAPQPVAQPVAPQPVAQPVAPQPVAPQPVAPQPVASQPVASQPVASQPAASQPVAPQPVASQPVAQPVVQPVAAQPTVTPSGEPLLRAGYRLRIAVMVGDAEELAPTEVMISDKEDIALPLVGRVSCTGLTLNGLQSRLVTRYSEFLRDPEISIAFVYSETGLSPYGQVLVQGRVMHEGWVNIPPTRDLTVSRAIQLAGGFSTSAKRSSVRVTRRKPDGKNERIEVDFKAIGKQGDLEKDILLVPDDVIFVDESNF